MSDAQEVRKRLRDPEPEVRRLATRKLATLPSGEAAALLVEALGDADWRVRKEAAQVAAQLPARAELVDRLYAALENKDDIGLRNSAVEALAALGHDAIAPGIGALGRLDGDGRKLVIEVLALAPDPRGAAALCRSLGDPDPNVRAAAAEALGRAAAAGEETTEAAIDALLRVLSDEDPGTRLAALRSLGALRADVDLSRLERHLADPLTRRASFELLACSSSAGALSRLAQLLANAPPNDARGAALALAGAVDRALEDEGRLDAVSHVVIDLPAARERMRAFATDEDAELRGAAVLLLGLAKNADDVALIVDALGDDEVAERAELALQLFGEDVVSPLVSAAMSAPPEVRRTSLSIVPMMEGPADPEALDGLRAAAADPSPDVASPALRSLAHVGTEADIALAARLTTGDDARIVQSARIALRGLGGRFPDAARAFVGEEVQRRERVLACCTLIEALDAEGVDPNARTMLARACTDRDARVRRAAVEALAVLGGTPAVDAATFALADEEPEVVLAAIRALGRLGQASTLADLVANTRSPSMVAQALRALAQADAQRAMAAARPLLRAPDAQVASAAIEAVQSAGGRARADSLLVALGHPDPEVVKLALAALAESAGASAVTGLATCLLHEAPEVRRLAAELLGQVGGAEARSLLRARLEREQDAGVRDAITQAVRQREGAKQ